MASSHCIDMFIICVSGSFFFVHISGQGTVNELQSVHVWYECILNISKAIYSIFETHFRILKDVEKPWQR